MTMCKSAVSDLVALDDRFTYHPNQEHSFEFISIGTCAKEAQDNTHGNDLCTDSTSEPAPGQNRRRKKNRPCKGKRLRYKKCLERLTDNVMTSPHLMDVQSVGWPPSLQNDFQKQQKLMMQLTEHKLQQLKTLGEPCLVNQTQDFVVVFRMSL